MNRPLPTRDFTSEEILAAESGRYMTDNELRTWRQQVISDATAAASAYVDEKIGELRSFFLNDDDDNPGLLTLLCVEIDRRTHEKIDAQIKQIPAGPVGPKGHLPPVKSYVPDTVHYKGECVTHAGACYQAVCDTARAPPHVNDWVCLAAAGRDGVNGASPRVRATFDADIVYKRLDIVALNYGAFIARQDDPGPCPGDGWQLICSRGRAGVRGAPGPRGEKGPQGETGVSIVGWEVDPENYQATPRLSDGTIGPPLALRLLFEQFHSEAAR